MLKFLSKLALAKTAWNLYNQWKRTKNSSNQSNGSFNNDYWH